jgi:hypothetical protein
MSIPRWMSLLRLSSLCGAVFFFAVGSACAQSATSHEFSSVGPNFESESSPNSNLLLADNSTAGGSANESSSNSPSIFAGENSASPATSEPALPAAPAPSGAAAAGQNNAGNGGSGSLMSHITFEGGFGFNPPAGGNQKKFITWGWNFTIGGGYQFTDHFSTNLEYQFIRDKLPGKLIAETGAQGGDAHVWSLTADPVYDFFPKATNDVYAVGGGGFYRKVTNFTNPEQSEYCSYYYCGVGYTNQTVGHFSSNQGGWSIGGGYIHRLGGMYGDSRMKLFAEVRYLDVLTPAVVHLQPNGLGATSVGAGTKLIPITLGVRW